MTTTELEKQFISEIAGELFEKENSQETDNEVLFRLRFSRDNYRLENQEINKLMADKEGCYITNIQRSLSKCLTELMNKYSQDILADIGEEDWQHLTKEHKEDETGRGKKGKWKIAYKWLWDYNFPQWVETNFWLCLEKRAKKNLDWMELKDDAEMAMVERLNLPKGKDKKTLKVSVKKPYWAEINLPESEGYLLLLNQGVVSRCVVSPSLAFALDYQLEKIRILPQKESWAYEEKLFNFEDLGIENFVAIALEKPLDLAWLKPNEEEVAPELTGKRMEELWQELEKQNNWRVYSQEVEVVG